MKENSIKLLVLFVFAFSFNGFSQLKKDFGIRYQETLRGKFTTIGNNTLSADPVKPTNDISVSNSTTEMKNVKIDNINKVFNASAANFNSPDLKCLAIKKAFLYWSATDVEKFWKVGYPISETENQPDWNFNDVKLMLPGETTYQTLTADDVIFRARDLERHFSNDPYTCVKDITKQVQDLASKKGNPYGTYTVANVESATGIMDDHLNGKTGAAGGWQIVFVYEYLDAPFQQITLYDGYTEIQPKRDGFAPSEENEVTINIEGFQTNPNKDVPINAFVLFGALDGDAKNEGDKLQIQLKNDPSEFITLGDDVTRFKDNFFNSSITVENSIFTDRVPASTNTLGFDAGVFKLDNTNNQIIGNNQKNTTLKLKTDKDVYGLYLLGFSVEVFKPDLTPVLLYTDVTSPNVEPNQTINNVLEFKNNGNDDAQNVTLTATLPNNVSFETPTNLPSGVTHTFNSTTRLLTFLVDNSLMKANSNTLKIPYSIKVKNNCYFLDNNCNNTSISTQFKISYTGSYNSIVETTVSSSAVTACKKGNDLPVNHNITVKKPIIKFKDINKKVPCDDDNMLKAAQALVPELILDCGNVAPKFKKIEGKFIPDGNGCNSNGKYVNRFVFDDICNFKIDDYVQTIVIFDNQDPTLKDCSTKLNNLTLTCDPNIDFNAQAKKWHENNLKIIAGCAQDNCAPITAANITSNFNFNSTDKPCTINETVSYFISDGCGNTLQKDLNILFKDTTPPSLAACKGMLSDTTIECSNDDFETIVSNWNQENIKLLQNCASDLCNSATINSSITLNKQCGNTGTATITYNAQDKCGNISDKSEDITVILTVEDTQIPFLAQGTIQNVTAACDGVPQKPQLQFKDHCSDTNVIVNYKEDIPVLTQNEDFTIKRTWTVEDQCKNKDTFTQTINVTAKTFDNTIKDNHCYEDGTIDLNKYLSSSPNPNSQWVILKTPTEVVLNNNIFDPLNIGKDNLGTYTFSYSSQYGLCFENTVVDIEINDDCVVDPCLPEDFTISRTVTPNNDVYNEYFTVKGSRECEFQIDLKIFNRWGSIIYENSDYKNDWNGYTNKAAIGGSTKVTSGTYYYVVNLINSGFGEFSGALYIGTK